MSVLLFTLRVWNAALAAIVNIVLCLILAAMVAVVTLQISARLHGTSVIWTSELTQYLMAWLTFLGMAAVYRGAGHIGVELFVDMLPERPRRLVYMAVNLLLAAFFLSFAWVAFEFVWAVRWSRAATLDIAMLWPYLALPVGSAIAFSFALEETLTGQPKSPELPGG
jgi:TRAP-type transport system small permease protein